jgi:hypothetical protein
MEMLIGRSCKPNAVKLRAYSPLLMERVGVRRIKNKANSFNSPLILTFSEITEVQDVLNAANAGAVCRPALPS